MHENYVQSLPIRSNGETKKNAESKRRGTMSPSSSSSMTASAAKTGENDGLETNDRAVLPITSANISLRLQVVTSMMATLQANQTGPSSSRNLLMFDHYSASSPISHDSKLNAAELDPHYTSSTETNKKKDGRDNRDCCDNSSDDGKSGRCTIS